MKLRPTHGMDPPQPGDGCKEEMSNNPVMWKRNSIHNTFEKVVHKAIWTSPLLINNAHATGSAEDWGPQTLTKATQICRYSSLFVMF